MRPWITTDIGNPALAEAISNACDHDIDGSAQPQPPARCSHLLFCPPTRFDGFDQVHALTKRYDKLCEYSLDHGCPMLVVMERPDPSPRSWTALLMVHLMSLTRIHRDLGCKVRILIHEPVIADADEWLRRLLEHEDAALSALCAPACLYHNNPLLHRALHQSLAMRTAAAAP